MKDFKLNRATLTALAAVVGKLVMTGKSYRVSVVEWKGKRSIKANAVYQSWYPAISESLTMTTPEAIRYVKFTFGLPILFSNKDFGGIIHAGLDAKGFFQVSYERQLEYMDKMPVTRLFTTEMHNKLRDDIQYFFGQQGLALEYEK